MAFIFILLSIYNCEYSNQYANRKPRKVKKLVYLFWLNKTECLDTRPYLPKAHDKCAWHYVPTEQNGWMKGVGNLIGREVAKECESKRIYHKKVRGSMGIKVILAEYDNGGL